MTYEEITADLNPYLYIGRSISQVEEFVETYVNPILDRLYDGSINIELRV